MGSICLLKMQLRLSLNQHKCSVSSFHFHFVHKLQHIAASKKKSSEVHSEAWIGFPAAQFMAQRSMKSTGVPLKWMTLTFVIYSLSVPPSILLLCFLMPCPPCAPLMWLFRILPHSPLIQPSHFFWSLIKLWIWGEITGLATSLPGAIILYAFNSHSAVCFKK